jgi:hypothetical protein
LRFAVVLRRGWRCFFVIFQCKRDTSLVCVARLHGWRRVDVWPLYFCIGSSLTKRLAALSQMDRSAFPQAKLPSPTFCSSFPRILETLNFEKRTVERRYNAAFKYATSRACL